MSWYSKTIEPELLFLFLIETLSPIFSLIEDSSALKFVSFCGLTDFF